MKREIKQKINIQDHIEINSGPTNFNKGSLISNNQYQWGDYRQSYFKSTNFIFPPAVTFAQRQFCWSTMCPSTSLL